MVTGVLATISKIEQEDPDAARELVRHALWDVLCQQADVLNPGYQTEVDVWVAKRSDETRRALVRTYISRRAQGRDVGDLLEAAEQAIIEDGLLSVSKDSSGPKYQVGVDNPATPKWDARDLLGQFTRAVGHAGGIASDVNTVATRPGDTQRYKDMRRAGQALTSLGGATGNATATAVGAATWAIGSAGPEAEKVLGSAVRRAAYRYRGTEKMADKDLRTSVKAAQSLVGESEDNLSSALRRGDLAAGAALRARAMPGASRDTKLLRARGDAAAVHFISQLPTEQEAKISAKAGQMPPSVGAIIDYTGHVRSEAQGYNGDHYLPFDLKNIARLNGGQYVRTRALGGPTDEDIYAMLMSGARQAQVVSRSGVFTIEMDPSIRGGRRYNDKAKRMVERYGRILDTLDKGGEHGLYEQDLPQEERARIRNEVSVKFRMHPERWKAETELAETKARIKLAQGPDDEELMAQAADEVGETVRSYADAGHNFGSAAKQRQAVEERFRELKAEAGANRVKAFQLDGPGYAAAMESLRREFPYYIRSVSYEPLPQFVQNRGGGGGMELPKGRHGADTSHRSRGDLRRPAYDKVPDAQPTAAAPAAAAEGTASAAPASAALGLNAQAAGAGDDTSARTLKVAVKDYVRNSLNLESVNLGQFLNLFSVSQTIEDDLSHDLPAFLAGADRLVGLAALNKMISGSSQPAKAAQVADWLTDPARTDDELVAVLRHLEGLDAKALVQMAGGTITDANAALYMRGGDALREAVQSVLPIKPGTEKEVLSPAVRPLKFDAISQLTTREDYESYPQVLKAQDDDYNGAMSLGFSMEKTSQQGWVTAVNDAANRANRAIAEAKNNPGEPDLQEAADDAVKFTTGLHMVWSFLYQRDIAERSGFLGKAPAPQAGAAPSPTPAAAPPPPAAPRFRPPVAAASTAPGFSRVKQRFDPNHRVRRVRKSSPSAPAEDISAQFPLALALARRQAEDPMFLDRLARP